jgi:hypothetical protein
MLGGNVPRGSGIVGRGVGHGGFRHYGQRRLEEVLEGCCMGRGRDELGPGRDLRRQSGVCLTVPVAGLVFVVSG